MIEKIIKYFFGFVIVSGIIAFIVLNVFPVKGDTRAVSFYGAALGGLIGGTLTLSGVVISINSVRDRNKIRDRRLRLSIKPYLRYDNINLNKLENLHKQQVGGIDTGSYWLIKYKKNDMRLKIIHDSYFQELAVEHHMSIKNISSNNIISAAVIKSVVVDLRNKEFFNEDITIKDAQLHMQFSENRFITLTTRNGGDKIIYDYCTESAGKVSYNKSYRFYYLLRLEDYMGNYYAKFISAQLNFKGEFSYIFTECELELLFESFENSSGISHYITEEIYYEDNSEIVRQFDEFVLKGF